MNLLRVASLCLLTALLGPALPAAAGCGCDHPPPAWTIVMPPFGSPGKSITVYAEEGAFTPGEVYEVDFGAAQVSVMATATDWVEVVVPAGAEPGPLALEVSGAGYAHTYSEAAFTALPAAETVPDYDVVTLKKKWPGAVSAEGTLLIPIDLGAVLNPTQFALTMRNVPLAFEHGDVVIYNADGVDLTLFALDTVDPTQHEWGSYYGWSVEEDTGIVGVVYDKKVKKALKKGVDGDVFTYWRHEFHTYKAAHEPGGTHEINENGHHPDGSLHIDHDHVVLAIQALRRDKGDPEDLSLATPLDPGRLEMDLVFAAYESANPLEPGAVQADVESELDALEVADATTQP